MKVTFEKRFLKDLQKINEKDVKQKVKEIIVNLEEKKKLSNFLVMLKLFLTDLSQKLKTEIINF